jgi:cytochrome c553
MFDFVGVLILVVLWLVFAFLARGSWHARNAILKWIGVMLAGLVTIVLTLVIVVVLIGFYRLNVVQAAPPGTYKVAGTPEQLARGQKIANFCTGCHSTGNKFPLDGASANFLAGGPPVGTIQPQNLTPAGPLKDWSDGEIARAIRDGVDKGGRPMLIMPADIFHNMSDADVQSVVAFLRSQQPAPHATEPTKLNALGALFVGAGLFQPIAQPPTTGIINSPPPGATIEYGKYAVEGLAGCRTCHGTDFGGGTDSQFGPPAGPNLTTVIAGMSEADFIKTIRTGTNPSGKNLDPQNMPWKETSATFDDNELKAIYMYIKSVPPVNRASPTPGR